MNWEAIGAVGEIVGAAAVVATLLYLARQTATNSRAIEASSAREVTLAEAEWHGELARDPELKRIMNQSMKVPIHDYSDEEWREFRFLAMRTFLNFEARHVDRSLRIGYGLQFDSRLSIAKGLISDFPAWNRFWEEEKRGHGFTQSYVDAVEAADVETDMRRILTGNDGDA